PVDPVTPGPTARGVCFAGCSSSPPRALQEHRAPPVPGVVAAAGTGAPLMSAHIGWFIIDGVSELTPYAAARELLCDVVVVMGVSASGKSTVAAVVAQRLGWAHIDADDYHPQANIDKMSAGQP